MILVINDNKTLSVYLILMVECKGFWKCGSTFSQIWNKYSEFFTTRSQKIEQSTECQNHDPNIGVELIDHFAVQNLGKNITNLVMIELLVTGQIIRVALVFTGGALMHS